MPATELTASCRAWSKFVTDLNVGYFRRRMAGNGSTLAVPFSSNGS